MRILKGKIRNWHNSKIFIGLVIVLSLFGIVEQVAQAKLTTVHQSANNFSNATFTSQQVQHIVIIEFENVELNDILSNGPYFKQLYETYGVATNYYAACHPSTSNYLAVTSGKTLQCGSDAVNLYNTTNIGTLLQNKNLSWYGFMESMPSNCYRDNSGEYVPKHNPFIYYSDLVNSNLCKEHDVPLTNWTNLVNQGNIPNFSFISPNILNDGHDTDVVYADNWLQGFLPPLLAKPWASSTIFFIVFDEGTTNNGFNGTSGGHTYLVAVSPYSKSMKVTSDTTNYNLLTTIEWLMDLGTTGNNDDPSKYTPMTGLFNFSNFSVLETQQPISKWSIQQEMNKMKFDIEYKIRKILARFYVDSINKK